MRGDRLEVVRTWLWQPARHHVGVGDRLDLLDTLRIGEPVERGGNAREFRRFRRHRGQIGAVGWSAQAGVCAGLGQLGVCADARPTPSTLERRQSTAMPMLSMKTKEPMKPMLEIPEITEPAELVGLRRYAEV
jgi:hypothetical protein